MDTLAVQLCTSLLPTRTRGFHPLERAHGAQTKNTGSKEPVTFSVKKILPGAVIGGLTCAVANIINLKLAIEVPSVVFFPIYSGGLIMTNALVSSFWFKEKLSARQKIAFVIGFVAVFMLANVF